MIRSGDGRLFPLLTGGSKWSAYLAAEHSTEAEVELSSSPLFILPGHSNDDGFFDLDALKNSPTTFVRLSAHDERKAALPGCSKLERTRNAKNAQAIA